MNTVIKVTERVDFKAKVYILNEIEQINKIDLSHDEIEYIKQHSSSDSKGLIHINRYSELLYFYVCHDEDYFRKEYCRKGGASLCKNLNHNNIEEVLIVNHEGLCTEECLSFAEGISLANYQFNKYKSKPKDNSLKAIYLSGSNFDADILNNLNIVMEATLWARDLVNEPVNHLNAVKFSEIIKSNLKEVGVEVEVFNKKKIESLKMGGLLAVNAGSIDEPTFSIAEWKPENSRNANPYIFVGKGVVYDTGGYNLKSGTNMMNMKSDMAGAATVAAALYAIAKAKLPFHVIALIPATDNRLDGNAHVCGDIISMYDGSSVEILNTDAEGRLILADALAYAKKYNPFAVFDFATLTGAASSALGPVATATMQKDADDIFNALKKAGEEVYERLVELPLWSEYGELIKSDIADIKNIGGKFGGAITAGKFLEHFTDYPWVHFDIAGTAFLDSSDAYRTSGATGVHVRLLMKFFENMLS